MDDSRLRAASIRRLLAASIRRLLVLQISRFGRFSSPTSNLQTRPFQIRPFLSGGCPSDPVEALHLAGRSNPHGPRSTDQSGSSKFGTHTWREDWTGSDFFCFGSGESGK
ncbi:hypothetical protein QQ045_002453 [Rhodiola kirilowii]